MSSGLATLPMSTAVNSVGEFLDKAEAQCGQPGILARVKTLAAGSSFAGRSLSADDFNDVVSVLLFALLRSRSPKIKASQRHAIGREIGARLLDAARLCADTTEDRLSLIAIAAGAFSSAGYNARAVATTKLLAANGASVRADSVGDEGAADDGFLERHIAEIVELVASRDVKAITAHLSGRTEYVKLDDIESGLAARIADVVKIHLETVGGGDFTAAKLDELRREIKSAALALGDADIYESILRLVESLELWIDRGTANILRKCGIHLPKAYEDRLFALDAESGIPELWPSQIDAIEGGAITAERFVVSMPTSAGKTLLAELRIAAFLKSNQDGLVVYLAPYNALAKQVGDVLGERHVALGISQPNIWTGTYELDEVAGALGSVVVMTPEKFDGVIRSSKGAGRRARDLVNRLGLLVVDESHMVGAGGRGLTLELILSRLKRRFPKCQILAMSALVSDPQKVASWLTGDLQNSTKSQWSPTERSVYVLRRSGRVETIGGHEVAVLGKWSQAIDSAFTVGLTLLRADRQPILVVETQRGYTEKLAERFAEAARGRLRDEDVNASRERAAREIADILGESQGLPAFVREGVAFHHAGLPQEARAIVEDLVRKELLEIVCSTTTLAEGVDMPFRALVIPHLYFNRELIPRALLQNMIGRVGRAKVGIDGTVVICEVDKGKKRADSLLSKLDKLCPIQSRLADAQAAPNSVAAWDKYLRLDSQLLAMLSDGTFQGEHQIEEMLGATLLGVIGKPDQLELIAAFLSRMFERMTAPSPPLATKK